MAVKKILKIISTNELCVYEGENLKISSGKKEESIHVRVINPDDMSLTAITRDVPSDDLVVHLDWDGSNYVPPA